MCTETRPWPPSPRQCLQDKERNNGCYLTKRGHLEPVGKVAAQLSSMTTTVVAMSRVVAAAAGRIHGDSPPCPKYLQRPRERRSPTCFYVPGHGRFQVHLLACLHFSRLDKGGG